MSKYKPDEAEAMLKNAEPDERRSIEKNKSFKKNKKLVNETNSSNINSFQKLKAVFKGKKNPLPDEAKLLDAAEMQDEKVNKETPASDKANPDGGGAGEQKLGEVKDKKDCCRFYKISPDSNLIELNWLRNSKKIIGELIIENISDRQMIFLIKPTDFHVLVVKPFRGVIQPFKTQTINVISLLEWSSRVTEEGLKLEMMQLEDAFDVTHSNMFELFNTVPQDPTKLAKIYIYCVCGGKPITGDDEMYSILNLSNVTRINELLKRRQKLFQMAIGYCKICCLLLGILFLGFAAYLYSYLRYFKS